MKFFEILKKNAGANGKSNEITIINVDDHTFRTEVVQSDLPVLAYLWAEWCPSCIRQSKVIDEIAGTVSQKMRIVKINVDQSRQIVQLYSIRSIPTILLIRNGLELKRMVGCKSKRAIIKIVKQSLPVINFSVTPALEDQLP